MEEQSHRSLAGYEVLRPIAAGGRATVRLARDRRHGRVVALKELHAFGGDDPRLPVRVVAELRPVDRLDDPNVVVTHEVFADAGRVCIAMEHVPHGSLRAHVRDLSLEQAAGVLEAVLAALAHAHGRGVVHGDVRPDNVLIAAGGGIKLGDFGLAGALRAVGLLEHRPARRPSPRSAPYLAPERADGDDAGPAGDLFAVGITAVELLTGRVPDGGTPQPALLRDRCERARGLLDDDVAALVDRGLAGWLARMTARDPADRPATVAEAWDQFEDIVIATAGPMWRRRAGVPVGPAARRVWRSGFVTFDPRRRNQGGAAGAGGADHGVCAARPAPSSASRPARHGGAPPTRATPARRAAPRLALAAVAAGLATGLAGVAAYAITPPAPAQVVDIRAIPESTAVWRSSSTLESSADADPRPRTWILKRPRPGSP